MLRVAQKKQKNNEEVHKINRKTYYFVLWKTIVRLVVVVPFVILAIKLCQIFIEFLVHNVEIMKESEPEHEEDCHTGDR